MKAAVVGEGGIEILDIPAPRPKPSMATSFFTLSG